ncbi:MAG: CRISPR-associated helicase Cas3' [Nitrosopumilaceae archaeon]|nr:CRISPR-associated helicase Cas3' [Nitrosopumilaceae archaeon]
MLSACTSKFLSHPIDEQAPLLVDHLLSVGKKSEELFSESLFSNKSLAFYSGLLHDVGKINPIYQKIFHEPEKNNRKNIEKHELTNYVKEHSRFSAWTADKLLQKIGLDYDTIDKILVLIYGHHTNIRKYLGRITKSEQFTASHKAIDSNLQKLKSELSGKPEFSKLNWDSCIEKFARPMNFDVSLNSKNSPDDYLEMSYAFSCLLQADRGSFHEWLVPNFDLELNTDHLSNSSKNNRLGKIRTSFQTQIMKNFDYSEPISIIHAPTGIGKTKVFLDIINKYANDKNIQRVFYFSPLLALTEDFERQLSNKGHPIITQNDQKDILVYNHLHSESLQEKNEENNTVNSNSWIFENESFNKKFVITTTQRLLMTLYSNKANDKMKLASFRNSVLIIDEVQTIPKSILSNLKEIFKKMNQYMGTKFILVSATIPHEIGDITSVSLSKDVLSDYILKTKKQISFISSLNLSNMPIKKTLIMANTRKKALDCYSKTTQAHDGKKVYYLSTGIRKKDRSEIIKKLSNTDKSSNGDNYVLVSTQVVEAGVDISFSHIYREEAPLDNIIQVMGRLNREGENGDAELVVYRTDGESTPYSQLEFKTTQEKIKKIKDSVDLYRILEEYYSEIYEKNLSNQDGTKKLEQAIKQLDFDKVWKFVKELALKEDGRDTVFIPDNNHESWQKVQNGLLSNDTSKKNLKEFGDMTASLPIPLHKLYEKMGENPFDEDLMEKNILLPKKEHLEKVYDTNTGLDKWLAE